MKRILLGVLLLVAHAHSTPALGARLTGTVVDASSGRPVSSVSVVVLLKEKRGVLADSTGAFDLGEVPDEACELQLTSVGYYRLNHPVSAAELAGPLKILLVRILHPIHEIEVTTTRAQDRKSAVAFTELGAKDISERYTVQDVPMLLAETPGVYAYSDAGNGVGYSYVQIRGFPQRRVAVTINGVPENDPESHEVYWVDQPDLLASTQSLQVQRGVGSALYGASGVGGSINLETAAAPEDRKLSAYAGFGSYNTRKFSFDYQSGLLDGKYSLSGRYSRILSDGYRDQSWTKLWAYYLSATRLDENLHSRLNVYGGPENLHLAYYGVSRDYLDGLVSGDAGKDRRANPLEWGGETDNFYEPHYELIQDLCVSSRASLTSSLFFFSGDGFYNSNSYGPTSFESHRLPNFEVDSDSLYPAGYYLADEDGKPVRLPNGRFQVIASDMTQRLWVLDKHYGWVPRARIQHDHGTLTVGGEWREHEGRHFGELTWAQALPPGSSPDYRYYDYTGHVRTLSSFVEEAWEPHPDVTVSASLQLRNVRYGVDHDTFNGYDFALNYTFLSPRLGANWNVSDRWNVFGSFSHVGVEPILSEIYSADDPSAVPLFRVVDAAHGIYQDPLINPEKLNDFEVGAGWRTGPTYLKLTGYWMDFRDEIVPNGQINPLGVPLTGNAARSSHRGIEAEGAWKPDFGLEVAGNLSISRNRFDAFREYVDSSTVLAHDGNTIAGFPGTLLNLSVGYRRGTMRLAASLTSVGRIYLDNSEDNRLDPAATIATGYQHLAIDPHTVLGAQFSVDLGALAGSKSLLLDVRADNLADTRYETAGYVDSGTPYFFPAAGRRVFAGLKAEF